MYGDVVGDYTKLEENSPGFSASIILDDNQLIEAGELKMTAEYVFLFFPSPSPFDQNERSPPSYLPYSINPIDFPNVPLADHSIVGPIPTARVGASSIRTKARITTARKAAPTLKSKAAF